MSDKSEHLRNPEILHAGCDGLTVALMGKLSFATLDRLEKLKATASEIGHEVGDDYRGLEFNVMETGTSARQGYAFQFHTGRDGIKYQAKRSGDSSQWNLRARVSALFLAAHGFTEAHKAIYNDLYKLEAVIIEESVSSVDFCADVRMDAPGVKKSKAFQIEPRNFVHHSKAKRKEFYSKLSETEEDLSILGGRYVETVTVGGRGNRQLCVYNKRTEQVAKRRGDWFAVWGAEKEDCPNVWRAEFRFGRDFLRDWNIKSLDDVNATYGDLIADSLEAVRYVKPGEDSNLSRAPNHEFWDTVGAALRKMSDHNRSGILRGKVRMTQAKDAQEMFANQALGLLASYAEALGLDETDDIAETFPGLISDLLQNRMKFEPEKFNKSRKRTRDRYINLRTEAAKKE